MRRELYIVGAGGFGRETADVVEAAARAAEPGEGWAIAGVFDDAPAQANVSRLADRGLAFLGPVPDEPPHPGAAVIVAIGAPVVRQRVVSRLQSAGWTFPTVIHPTAVVGSQVTLGDGVVLCAGVNLSTNVTLDNHVHVNPNATVGHDSVLRNFASINPAAVVSGEVLIERGVLLGAGCVILQNITVGENSIVGAMACVTKPVPHHTVVMGVPARPSGPVARRS
ncbi:NeuD/PglB/VioB family sugar acetyltransferase [Micrococcus luteus]|nr:NeuD/PglB/VioB family sugar acetyltransferase [Micrococcus luteus]MCV7556922.1 NeuD/PglB/VioB family sugar acetyltransferase [Micrococcus luteus]